MSVWLRKIVYRLVLCRTFTTLIDWWSPEKGLGKRGELEAERYLLKQGFIVLERGYADKLGEIDLIGVHQRTIVFVEVKTRSGESVIEAVDAVDRDKQAHITRTAKAYLKWHHLEECCCRFDVIAIIWDSKNSVPKIFHYTSAFDAAGDYQMY